MTAINLQRRKAVMSRSIKLGHCVCNPRQGCPCDLFKSHNVCPCAGEHMPAPSGPVLLTRLARKAGCASKIGQSDLKRILGQLPPVTDPKVLLGLAAGDDAGVYELNEGQCLVQTVDVFTPCVDDAYLFGQIAAANSVSDIYAMGGRPATALSIIGFPVEELDPSIMEALLRGGMDKLDEARCSLIGGHSLINEEVLCGFAVTGLVERSRVVARDRARPEDALVLTKPLGTGMISFAAQIGRVPEKDLAEAGRVMATLNRDAAELMIEHGACAATDITGFGLAGHLVEMARNSAVDVELDLDALPLLGGAIECLKSEILPGAIERNMEYAFGWVEVSDLKNPELLPILYDPQTSGGLLVSLPEENAAAFVRALHERGHLSASVVGRVKAKSARRLEVRVQVVQSGGAAIRPEQPSGDSAGKHKITATSSDMSQYPSSSQAPPLSCCDGSMEPRPARDGPSAPTAETAGAPIQPETHFMDFLRLANKPGAIDARSKKLMVIALSVAQRCEPCLKTHLRSALEMGLSQAEIDEAAWLGIAFAGSPAMMLYNSTLRSLGR